MFIDTHAHTYHDQFDQDLDDMIQRSKDAQVDLVLLPNIDASTVVKMFQLCQKYNDHFRPMIGLHPCDVKEDYQDQLVQLKQYLDHDSVIAIGETGIDLYWDTTYKDQQIQALKIHIQWAKELNLPIVLHTRESIDLTIDLIAEHQDGTLRGVFHCFGGSTEQARRIMDLGFYMGIGGTVTFKNNKVLRDNLETIPLDSIILETDAPYLTPHPYRGKRNESSYIPLIAKTLSEIYMVNIDDIAAKTTDNAKKLFKI